MSIPKQFVNLIGAVVVVALLVLGVTLVALPLYTNSQTVDVSTSQVAQTNNVYGVQVAQLSAANDRIDEIDANVATLREQITPILKIDDIIETVIVAAVLNEASIENLTVAEVEAWTPRVGSAAADASMLATASDPTAPQTQEQTATDDSVGTTTEDVADAADGAAPAADDAAAETPAPAPETDAESPQRQIPITIEVKVNTAAQASAFMDALGTGKRLIVPTSGKYDAGTLMVTAYALMRTGD